MNSMYMGQQQKGTNETNPNQMGNMMPNMPMYYDARMMYPWYPNVGYNPQVPSNYMNPQGKVRLIKLLDHRMTQGESSMNMYSGYQFDPSYLMMGMSGTGTGDRQDFQGSGMNNQQQLNSHFMNQSNIPRNQMNYNQNPNKK